VLLADLLSGDGPDNPISPGDRLRLDTDDETVYSDSDTTIEEEN
jgi:hypothetical protein